MDWKTAGQRVLIPTLLLVAVGAPFLLTWHPSPVDARCYSYQRHYITKCRGGCGQTAGAITGCEKMFRRRGAHDCRLMAAAEKADCTSKRCKAQVRKSLAACIKDRAQTASKDGKYLRYGTKKCGSCCQRSCGEGGCTGYFSQSRFYGSYRYHGRLLCRDNYAGSPSEAFLGSVADTVRRRLAALVPFLVDRWSSD